MARIRLKERDVEIEVEADEMQIAEETFAKIADGIAGAFEHSKDAKLYNALSGAFKKE